MRELVVSLADGTVERYPERSHEVAVSSGTLIIYEYSEYGNPQGLHKKIKRCFSSLQWKSFEERG